MEAIETQITNKAAQVLLKINSHTLSDVDLKRVIEISNKISKKLDLLIYTQHIQRAFLNYSLFFTSVVLFMMMLKITPIVILVTLLVLMCAFSLLSSLTLYLLAITIQNNLSEYDLILGRTKEESK